jgi:hypothetical protein
LVGKGHEILSILVGRDLGEGPAILEVDGLDVCLKLADTGE